MPKGRKDEMPTYNGLNGSKVAIKRGSNADKDRIKEKQESYARGTKIDPPISSKTNLKVSSKIAASVAAIKAKYAAKKSKLAKSDAKKSKLEKKFK